MQNYNLFAGIVDGACVVVFLFVLISYWRRGFLAGLVSLGGNLAALAGSWYLSTKVAPTLFENFFRNSILDSTAQTISESGQNTISGLLGTVSKILPESLAGQIDAALTSTVTASAPNLAEVIVDTIIMPLILPLISAILFFVMYAVLRMLVAFITKALIRVNRAPLLGTANRIGGLFLGIFSGVLDVAIALALVWAVLTLAGDAWPNFNLQALQSSFCFSFFTAINPFAGV